MTFRRLTDVELSNLTDEALVDYLRRARDAGDADSALLALRMLVFGFEPRIRGFVRMRVPEEAVDAVTDQVLDSGFTSIFSEESIESFRAWIFRIARRRVADYTRRKNPRLDPLPEEHADDEEIFGEMRAHDDETGFVALTDVVEDCLSRFDKQAHRRVVELAIFAQVPTRENCELVNEEFPDLDPPMSESNVDQIKSRFRRDLREALESD